jgi:hypothetical protein
VSVVAKKLLVFAAEALIVIIMTGNIAPAGTAKDGCIADAKRATKSNHAVDLEISQGVGHCVISNSNI